MNKISDYQGALLNHMGAVYRPGERALAVELVEALGLTAVDVPVSETMSLVAVHPNSDDRDMTNNVFFLNEMTPGQAEFDTLLRKKVAEDPEMRDGLRQYAESARTSPEGNPHFGLRFRSTKALEPVLDRLQNLSPALGDRVSVNEMPYYGVVADFPDIRQIFVYTDVFTVGSPLHGQLIELQVERGK